MPTITLLVAVPPKTMVLEALTWALKPMAMALVKGLEVATPGPGIGANINVRATGKVGIGGRGIAGIGTQGHIVIALSMAKKRLKTHRRVSTAGIVI